MARTLAFRKIYVIGLTTTVLAASVGMSGLAYARESGDSRSLQEPSTALQEAADAEQAHAEAIASGAWLNSPEIEAAGRTQDELESYKRQKPAPRKVDESAAEPALSQATSEDATEAAPDKTANRARRMKRLTNLALGGPIVYVAGELYDDAQAKKAAAVKAAAAEKIANAKAAAQEAADSARLTQTSLLAQADADAAASFDEGLKKLEAKRESECMEYAKNPTRLANAVAIQKQCMPMYQEVCNSDEAKLHPGVEHTCSYFLTNKLLSEFAPAIQDSIIANGDACRQLEFSQSGSMTQSKKAQDLMLLADQVMADFNKVDVASAAAELGISPKEYGDKFLGHVAELRRQAREENAKTERYLTKTRESYGKCDSAVIAEAQKRIDDRSAVQDYDDASDRREAAKAAQ